MHGRSAIWFPLLLLALLAALTFWIDRVVQPPPPPRDGSARHDPDYVVNNFVMNKSDIDGNPRYTLAAISMTHFPDDDTTDLVRPRFTQYFLRKPTTQVQSQRGHVSSNRENVYFMDNVKAVREATKSQGELVILTEYLHIIPEQEIMATDRPVKITQAPRTVITAGGMELNKKQRTLKLFQRVRAHYEAPQAAARNEATAAPPDDKPRVVAKKPKRSKPLLGKPKTTTGSPQRRIRRHYEISPTR